MFSGGIKGSNSVFGRDDSVVALFRAERRVPALFPNGMKGADIAVSGEMGDSDAAFGLEDGFCLCYRAGRMVVALFSGGVGHSHATL